MKEAETALKVLPPHIPCSRTFIDGLSAQAWEDSLPEHLRYTEENLHIMNSMYETPANTGAWCFFYMHALHSCCEMSAASVRFLDCSAGSYPVLGTNGLLPPTLHPIRKCKCGMVVESLLCRSPPPMPGTDVCGYSNLLVHGRRT